MIPSQAEKVFDGVMFDIHQWEQELFDGSKTTFEMAKERYSTVIIPIMDDGRILLTKQEQPGRKPFFGVVGGHVEDNETIDENARNELLQETGMVCDMEEIGTFVHGFKLDYQCKIYVGRNCKKIQEPSLDAGEKIETFLATIDEFLDMIDREELIESRALKMVFKNELSAACRQRITKSLGL